MSSANEVKVDIDKKVHELEHQKRQAIIARDQMNMAIKYEEDCLSKYIHAKTQRTDKELRFFKAESVLRNMASHHIEIIKNLYIKYANIL